jgi:hypothetical protein
LQDKLRDNKILPEMHLLSTVGTALVPLLILGSIPTVTGHSWIEQLRAIGEQGEYVGEYGYPRGMYSKTDPGFDGDRMNWQVPSVTEKTYPFISENSPLCHTSQTKQNQSSDKYPRLQITPGGFFAMRYAENGHITLPTIRKGKPEKSGTIYIYGTTEPKEDEKLADVLQWTQDGQGGDKRGKILAMNQFDDGRCYELNPNSTSKERQKATPNYAMGQKSDGPGNFPLYCESNAAIPKDAATGKPYTVYWVWQWFSYPGQDPGLPSGQDEYYTTCMDIDVVEVMKQNATQARYALGQQDAMSKAVSDYRSRKAILTDAIAFEMGPVFNSSGTGGVHGPPATQAPAQSPAATSAGVPTPANPMPTPSAPPAANIPAPSAPANTPAPMPSAPTATASTNVPAPMSSAPAAGAPANIPTLLSRPGGKPGLSTQAPPLPSAAPSPNGPGGDIVTVFVTTKVTVTANPGAAATPSAQAKRDDHIVRHVRNLRGRFFGDE